MVNVLEYDEDLAFGTPVTIPEQLETRWTPPEDLVEGQVCYRCVKAKDISHLRWTEWSPVRSVEVDSTVPEGLIWRQGFTAPFDSNTLTELSTSTYRIESVKTRTRARRKLAE